MSFEQDMERHKKVMEMSFVVIDGLTPEARAVIHEHNCPAIDQLIMVGISAPEIIPHVEAWAKTMLTSSQPQASA